MTENNTLHYLDYAATTPVDPRVIESMAACLGADGIFGNPPRIRIAPGGSRATRSSTRVPRWPR